MPTLPINDFVNEPTFNVTPISGNAPLQIVVDSLVIDILTTSDPRAVATAGYAHTGSTLSLPQEVATAGYFKHPAITFYFWEFGTGDQSFVANPTYTYNTPGTFFLTLKYTFLGTVYDVKVEITVKEKIRGEDPDSGDLASTPLVFVDDNLHYGDNAVDGFGWAQFGGPAYVRPENGESVITTFLKEDQLDLCYDRRDGLLWILNPRKDSNIGESFLDKVDPIQSTTGTDIAGNCKGEVITGSDEIFKIRPMEIVPYIRALFQEYKGDDDSDGLLSSFKLSVFLFKAQDINPISGLSDVNFNKQGSFFADGQYKEDQQLQIGFSWTASRFRLDKYTVKLVVYDKANYVSFPSQKDNILLPVVETVPDFLYKNTLHWITRPNNGIDQGTYLPGNQYGKVAYPGGENPIKSEGPDGRFESAFEFATSTLIPNFFGLIPLFTDVFLWSDNSHPFTNPPASFAYVTIIHTFVRNTVTWYFIQAASNSYPALTTFLGGTKIFDLRVIEESLVTDAVRDFMTDDIVNNDGDSICPH